MAGSLLLCSPILFFLFFGSLQQSYIFFPKGKVMLPLEKKEPSPTFVGKTNTFSTIAACLSFVCRVFFIAIRILLYLPFSS